MTQARVLKIEKGDTITLPAEFIEKIGHQSRKSVINMV